MPARMAMMAMTTRSSMSVKALLSLALANIIPNIFSNLPVLDLFKQCASYGTGENTKVKNSKVHKTQPELQDLGVEISFMALPAGRTGCLRRSEQFADWSSRRLTMRR